MNDIRFLDKPKPMDYNNDERFRRSCRGNNSTFTARCFTPDDSLSNSSAVERNQGKILCEEMRHILFFFSFLVDSIEEHFARSLAKYQPSNDNEHFHTYHQITESVVDDHFARALGSNTWGRLKDRS